MGNIIITGYRKEATINVPIISDELKFFFDNYKEYFYLPAEDMAVHKSVASFVDREYREAAHASNCYTRKTGSFLPQFRNIMQPEFRREYKDEISYFEVTDDFCSSDVMLRRYVDHILNHMADKRK